MCVWPHKFNVFGWLTNGWTTIKRAYGSSCSFTFAMLLILSKAHSKHWRPTTRLLKDTRAHKSRILSILRPSKNYTTPKRSFCWLTFITFFSVFYSFLPHYPAVILAKQNLKNLQRNYFTHTTRIILKKFYF